MCFNEILEIHDLQIEIYINIFYFLYVTLMINVKMKIIGSFE